MAKYTNIKTSNQKVNIALAIGINPMGRTYDGKRVNAVVSAAVVRDITKDPKNFASKRQNQAKERI